ncbi:proline-rich protein 4-like [Hordeum vulgare subsp. vulgare]|nr:proline-rich protein 4-like [Hordeum vulgare subsp. vulgare]
MRPRGSGMAAPRALAICVLLAIAVANAEAASVVIGLAKCADCTGKNIKAEEAFKALQVAIKCRNSAGEYESKAVGALDGTGAFSVPLAADLHGADCVAQLHSAASNAPCPGQEPSKIVPVSEGTTYGIVAGDNTATPSATSPECASMTLCGPIKKHIMEHFHHKKPVPPKPEPKPEPHPDYGPVPKPEPKPQPHPDYHPVPPTPTYGGGGGGGGYHGHH